MNQAPTFFGLLRTPKSCGNVVNTKVHSAADQLDLYILNAVTLCKSLYERGYKFVLLVDDQEGIRARLARLGVHLETREIAFTTLPPPQIPFYEAHFKIDAIRHLGSLELSSVALIDLDVIMLRDFPKELRKNFSLGKPFAYDITDQVTSAYGREKIEGDMKILLPGLQRHRWYGGELICGKPGFFSELSKHIDALWQPYESNWQELHHQGDEMIVSVALNAMTVRGLPIEDLGRELGIFRYWSGQIRHQQPPFYSVVPKYSLLHLPQDKRLLASFSKHTPYLSRAITGHSRIYFHLTIRFLRMLVVRAIRNGKLR